MAPREWTTKLSLWQQTRAALPKGARLFFGIFAVCPHQRKRRRRWADGKTVRPTEQHSRNQTIVCACTGQAKAPAPPRPGSHNRRGERRNQALVIQGSIGATKLMVSRRC